MRTTVWSLATLAGGALASPGWGSWSNEKDSGWGNGAPPGYSGGSWPSSWSGSWGSSSSAPVSAASAPSGGHPHPYGNWTKSHSSEASATTPTTRTIVTVTDIATTYTTVCPIAEEHTSSGIVWTSTLSSELTTSTIITSYKSTITLTEVVSPTAPGWASSLSSPTSTELPGWGSGSGSGPWSSAGESSSPVSPVETGFGSGSGSWSGAGASSSPVAAIETGSGSGAGSGSETCAAGGVTTVTVAETVTVSVTAGAESGSVTAPELVPYGTWTPSGFSTWPTQHTPGEVVTSTSTVVTTYTTVCPETSEYTSGSATFTSTGTITTSVVTTSWVTTFTSTVSASGYPSGPAGGSPPPYSGSHGGHSQSGTGTIPPYGGHSQSGTGTVPPYGGSTPIPPFNGSSTSYSVGPTSGHPTGPTTTGPTGPGTSCISSYTTYSTLCTETTNGTTYSTMHTHSAPVCSQSSPSGPIGTGPHSSWHSTGPYGNGTTTAVGPTGTVPAGTGPTGTGTSPTKSKSTCSAPKPTQCTPCKGQMSNNWDRTGESPFCGLTINDNPYTNTPETCQVREYWFEITNTTVAPDGIPVPALLVNGQMPGPMIEANWGDTIVVHVTNQLTNNGTTVHWHGLRQYYTNDQDGVPSITQCPLAPGESQTYTFRADNYGTSWYHSHFSLQAWESVMGPIVIHGPSSDSNYDEEQVVVLSDWAHVPVMAQYDAAQDVGPTPKNGPRILDNGLINGMNVWAPNGSIISGERFTMSVEAGSTYRLRIINTAIQSTFKFSIDGHKMKVIAADFVPLEGYEADVITINEGQRYDVLVTFDQAPGNYWMRSDNAQECAQLIQWDNIKGVISYKNAAAGIPTSTAFNYSTAPGAGCADEPYASLTPYYKLNAGGMDQTISETVTIAGDGGTPNVYKWSLSGTYFQAQYGDPTLWQIMKNGSVPTTTGRLAIEEPTLNEWVYLIIDTPIPFPHPVSFHRFPSST